MTKYYDAPEDKIFDELKQKATEIWSSYDDQFGYATNKINNIKDVKNIRDNFMYMVAMFDLQNQAKLSTLLSEDAKKEIRDRMLDGGNIPQNIVF